MEEGSHEELLKIPDGVYANLINMQAGREEEEADIRLSIGDDVISDNGDYDIPGLFGP